MKPMPASPVATRTPAIASIGNTTGDHHPAVPVPRLTAMTGVTAVFRPRRRLVVVLMLHAVLLTDGGTYRISRLRPAPPPHVRDRPFNTLGAGMHADTPGHAFALIDKGKVLWYRDYWLPPTRSMYVSPSKLLADIPAT